jgi:hypothetical protein
MYQFDEYINSLIGDLKINKKMKDEMAEEFRDHLEMLKLEYVSKGISENEAVKNAIESFGQENILKRRIADSVLNYRNNTNIFTGIILLLLVLSLGLFIPVPAVDASEFVVSGAIVLSMSSSSSILFLFMSSLSLILLFIPLGYFIPVVFLKVKKARHVTIATLPLGVLIGLYLSIITLSFLPIGLRILIFLASLFGSMLGSMLGYGILIIISRSSLRFTNSIHKMR